MPRRKTSFAKTSYSGGHATGVKKGKTQYSKGMKWHHGLARTTGKGGYYRAKPVSKSFKQAAAKLKRGLR